jgi:hypothetical protein
MPDNHLSQRQLAPADRHVSITELDLGRVAELQGVEDGDYGK